jgi:hypothetical protein
MAQIIKLEKSISSKLDQAKCLLKVYCAFMDIKLSKSEEDVMCFFMIYGINKKTKDMIIDSHILKGQNSVANSITELSKKKLLVKAAEKDSEQNSFLIIPSLRVKFEGMLGLMIKIERI